jgi:hypothetical protein
MIGMTAAVSLTEIANLSQIVGVPAAVYVIFLAYRQLKSATAAAEAEAVLALDGAFAQFEALRSELEAAEAERQAPSESSRFQLEYLDPYTRAELSRYLVVFERLGLLVRRGLIDLQLASDTYGYALARVLRRTRAPVIICEDLQEAQRGGPHSERRWENLIRLWHELPRQPKVPEDIERAARAQQHRTLNRLRRTLNRLRGRKA